MASFYASHCRYKESTEFCFLGYKLTIFLPSNIESKLMNIFQVKILLYLVTSLILVSLSVKKRKVMIFQSSSVFALNRVSNIFQWLVSAEFASTH